MRKTLAFFTAAVCCFGILTACGSEKNSSKNEKTSDEKTTASETSGSDESVQDASGDEFAEIFRSFYLSGDSAEMLRVSLPDDVVTCMENIGAADEMSEALASTVEQTKVELPEMTEETVEYVSVRECNQEFRSKLEKLYSAYYHICKAMEDNDISYEEYIAGNVDDSRMKPVSEAVDIYEKLCNGEEATVESVRAFDDVKIVTMSINGDHTDFVMYKFADEGWKLDTIGLAIYEY